jgi:hypothetical protein
MHPTLTLALTVAGTAGSGLPAPQVPAGFSGFSTLITSWLVWGVRAAGIIGLLVAALMIIVGRRNRNQLATEGVFGSVWVGVGIALASSAALLVDAVLGAS